MRQPLRTGFVIGATIMFAVWAGVAWADKGGRLPVGGSGVYQGYPDLTDDTTAYRSGLSGGEAFTILGPVTTDTHSGATGGGTVAAVTSIWTTGHMDVVCWSVASVASSTVVVTMVPYNWDGTTATPGPAVTRTLTAQGVYTHSSKYTSEPTTFDTQGFKLVKILARDPSSGAVDLWVKVK